MKKFVLSTVFAALSLAPVFAFASPPEHANVAVKEHTRSNGAPVKAYERRAPNTSDGKPAVHVAGYVREQPGRIDHQTPVRGYVRNHAQPVTTEVGAIRKQAQATARAALRMLDGVDLGAPPVVAARNALSAALSELRAARTPDAARAASKLVDAAAAQLRANSDL